MVALFRKQNGGITLEAALVLPIFISFVIFLTIFVKLSIVQISLQTVVSESTKIIASYSGPVIGAEDDLEKGVKDLVNKKMQEMVPLYDYLAPVFNIDSMINSLIETVVTELLDSMEKEFGKHLIDDIALSNGLGNKILIEEFEMSKKDIYIKASYSYDMKIPFFSRSFNLQANAYEYLWLIK